MPCRPWSFVSHFPVLLVIEKKQAQGRRDSFKSPRTTKTHQNHSPQENWPLTFSSVPLADVWHPGSGIFPLLNDDFYFATLGGCTRSWRDFWFWGQRANDISIYFCKGNRDFITIKLTTTLNRHTYPDSTSNNWYSLSTYYMPGCGLSTLHTVVHLALKQPKRSQNWHSILSPFYR